MSTNSILCVVFLLLAIIWGVGTLRADDSTSQLVYLITTLGCMIVSFCFFWAALPND